MPAQVARFAGRKVLMVTAWIACVLPPVAAQTRNPAHDMRDALLRKAGGDQTATCVYCHAPLGARAEAAQAPRWQRSPVRSFSVYGVTTVEASTFEGGASLLCMSCHDASQAPVVGGSPNDHPVGIGYAGIPGARSPLPTPQQPRTVDATLPAHDLRNRRPPGTSVVAGFRAASRGVINERAVWWIATTPNSARRTRSDLPLYAPDGEASTLQSAAPTVECATCHDPHNDNPMFLRISNEGSRLCLSCHDS